MTPHRLYVIRLTLIVLTAIVAFGSFAIAASAQSPLRATITQLAGTVTYNCPDSPDSIGAAAYAQDMPEGTPDNVCIPGEQEPGTFDHEMGHVFDYQHMDVYERGQFTGIMDTGRPWRGGSNPPVEQFAEAFRMCASNPRRPDRWEYSYAYNPTRWQHRAVCRLIVRSI